MSSLDLLLHQIANPTELAWNEETYDLALASGLSAADRSTFIAKLRDLAGRGDTHAILTLGHLQATEALPMLQAAARSAKPWAPTARRALVLLGHGAEVVLAIAADATRAPAKMARVAAVMDLGKIGGAAAITALQQALADPDSAVRMLAWDSLIEALGLVRVLQSPDSKRELTTQPEVLRVLLASDIPAFARMGADEMRKLTQRLQAGASPQSLGIVWTPAPSPAVFAALREVLFDPGAPFPVDQIARLTGVPRYLAETMIAMRLEEQDPRVPDALARLHAAWTAPALDEVASSPATDPELRAALAEAVRSLRSS